MFTRLKEMNLFWLESFENIVAKEEIAPARKHCDKGRNCSFQMLSAVADVKTSIYGVKVFK